MIVNIRNRLLRAIGSSLLLVGLASCATTKATVKPDNCGELVATYKAAKENHAKKLPVYEACEKEKCGEADKRTCYEETCKDEYEAQDKAREAEVEAHKASTPCRDEQQEE